MATVIGIFENQYINNMPLTVVRPGSQSRRFTHVNDTIDTCFYAWKRNKCRHYSISNKKVIQFCKLQIMFETKIRLLPHRRGERYASAMTNMSFQTKFLRDLEK